jgi:SAM-dependent methyltransferase
VAVNAGVSVDTICAFDSVAQEYDRSNSENSILREMRRRTLAVLAAHVPAGHRVLDLGCGPGTDAVTLARAGYHVAAIDWSPAMVEEARRRILRANLEPLVSVHRLAIEELDQLEADHYEAAYSNFGPLNCVADLEGAAHAVARRLRPGGILVASVIGRVCPWELALYVARGDRARAGIRFARDLVPVPLNGRTVWTQYYTPRAFERIFAAAGFKRVALRALGLFVPPPYMNAFADRHPRLTAGLHAIEDALGAWPGVRQFGDHFLIVMRKTGSGSVFCD